MPDPLTQEQIELLRSLPPLGDPDALILGMDTFDTSDMASLTSQGWAEVVKSLDKKHYGIQRTPAADTLLATIDAERERARQEAFAEIDAAVARLDFGEMGDVVCLDVIDRSGVVCATAVQDALGRLWNGPTPTAAILAASKGEGDE